MENFLRFRRHAANVQRLKFLGHAKQGRLERAPLFRSHDQCKFGGGKETWEKEKDLLWYHPAFLQLDNKADAQVFVHLTHMVEFCNGEVSHKLSKNEPYERTCFKDLKQVYEHSLTCLPHNNIQILNYPRMADPDRVDYDSPRTKFFRPLSEFDPPESV